jgi:hypothetical protein
MKRYGDFFTKIVDMENLHEAYCKASKGKHWQRNVRTYDADPIPWLMKLKELLEQGAFHTASYTTKQIYEPKERTIYILPFYPDRIVHHAVMNVLEPVFDKLMIYDSYSCRKGKGQHAGSRRCMEMVRHNRYCLKCDISKFYPSVNHEVLKKILRHKLKDKRLLALLDDVIDSTHTDTNVPIGNYLSQWFGNLYMNELDTYTKQHWHIRDYIRYCDDFCFFSNDKDELRKIRAELPGYLANTLKLKLSKCQLFPTAQGVDFLGYRHFPRYILVRKKTAARIRRHLREVMHLLKQGRISQETAKAKVASARGWVQHANAHHYAVANHIDELWEEVSGYA